MNGTGLSLLGSILEHSFVAASLFRKIMSSEEEQHPVPAEEVSSAVADDNVASPDGSVVPPATNELNPEASNEVGCN